MGRTGDEQEGIGKGGSAGTGEQQAVEGGGCGAAAARELPAGEAAVEAISGGRRCGTEASQRGTSDRIARTQRSFGGKVLRLVREKYSGAVGERFGPTLAAEHLEAEDGLQGGCGDVAAVDAGGRVVESRAEAATASAAARAQGALWGVGADGRQLSRVAGRARSGGLLDRHGG